MDSAHGAGAWNTIATSAYAFASGRFADGPVTISAKAASPVRAARRRVFLNYLDVLVLLHHAVIFRLRPFRGCIIAAHIICVSSSAALSVAFIRTIARIFTKLPVRV